MWALLKCFGEGGGSIDQAKLASQVWTLLRQLCDLVRIPIPIINAAVQKQFVLQGLTYLEYHKESSNKQWVLALVRVCVFSVVEKNSAAANI